MIVLMDCYQALEILEAEALGAWPHDLPGLEEAQKHLAACAHCQQNWPQRRAFSQQLSARMVDVQVPADLAGRLREQLALASGTTTTPRPLGRRRAVLLGLSLASAAVVAWFLLVPAPDQPVSLEVLQAAVDIPLNDLLPFQGSFVPQLPREWEPFFDLTPQMLHGYPTATQFGGDEVPRQLGKMALVPFQFTLRGGSEPLRGRLLILQTSQLQPPQVPRESFATADIYYLPQQRGAWMVWSEGEYVYACLMPTASAPAALQQFRRALLTSRPLS